MSAQTTWKPHTEHGDLTTRSNLPESVYAFPRQRKEPLTDASHVKNTLVRFDQVEGVSDASRACLRQYQEGRGALRRDRQGEELARPRIAPLSQFPHVKLLREPATSRFPPHLSLPAFF